VTQPGVEVFDTDPGRHDDYYRDPGSRDLRNVGNIVVGNYDAVHEFTVPAWGANP
jgi:hypothetical protein